MLNMVLNIYLKCCLLYDIFFRLYTVIWNSIIEIPFNFSNTMLRR